MLNIQRVKQVAKRDSITFLFYNKIKKYPLYRKPYIFMKKTDVRALLSFMTFSDPSLSALSNKVISSLTGNPNFTNLGTLLPDLSAALDDFNKLLPQAQGGSRLQIANKNASREALLSVLRNVAYEVNYLAKGDRSILLSSGFNISGDTKKTIVPVTNISNLKVA